MIHPIGRLCALCGIILLLSSPASSQAPAKRALTHADYAAWRSIQQPTLSPDGTFVAYGLTPQEADGEFVLRNVSTGKEFRHTIGSQPAAGRPSAKGGNDARITRYAPDGKHVLFAILPDQAARAKPPAEAGRADLGIMDVRTGP